MREIKFRAWDKKEERFVKSFHLTENGVVKVWDGSRWGENQYNTEYGIELMQYTGLKDKNGKGIYEKDLVNDGGVVTFLGGRYIIDYGNGDNWEDLIGEEDEIIGNIYENPDLLPTKTQE